MHIGEASNLTGLPSKTIRYYEDIDLVTPGRSANGYRDYSEEDVHFLSFLGRARKLGFTVEECRTLLSLYRDAERSSSEVKSLALNKIQDIEHRIQELEIMKSLLITLAKTCHGDDKPDCPILEGIANLNGEK